MSREVQAVAKKLIDLDIPYLAGGRNLLGLDCYGLLLMFMRELGLELPDFTYQDDWYKHGGNLLIENYHQYAVEIERDEMQPGDVIMFENHPGVANHFGVFLGYGKFIHAVEGIGIVIGRLNVQPHNRRVHSCYRMKREKR